MKYNFYAVVETEDRSREYEVGSLGQARTKFATVKVGGKYPERIVFDADFIGDKMRVFAGDAELVEIGAIYRSE